MSNNLWKNSCQNVNLVKSTEETIQLIIFGRYKNNPNKIYWKAGNTSLSLFHFVIIIFVKTITPLKSLQLFYIELNFEVYKKCKRQKNIYTSYLCTGHFHNLRQRFCVAFFKYILLEN